jgi:hypothetical protein
MKVSSATMAAAIIRFNKFFLVIAILSLKSISYFFGEFFVNFSKLQGTIEETMELERAEPLVEWFLQLVGFPS